MALALAAAAAASAHAITINSVPAWDLRGPAPGEPGPPAQFLVRPYIQNTTASGVTVMWQSDIPARAVVTVSYARQSVEHTTHIAKRFHEVRVSGLRADTEYIYSVGLLSSLDESAQPSAREEYTFRTFPSRPRPLRFLVYGDTRTRPDKHAEVANAMAAEKNIDFVLHTGDLVADGRRLREWPEQFLGPAANLMRGVPVFCVLGNHERASPYYYQYMSLPMNEQWYSFTVGDVHVVGLDSCSDFDVGSQQYEWLISDLDAHRHVRWKFVFMHHPTYTSGNHGGVGDDRLPVEKPIRVARRLMPELARRYRIAAFFAGHDHAYERSTRDGVRYIVSGGGGAPNYGDPNAEHNPYREVFHSVTHYCLVEIDGRRGHVAVKTPDGTAIDTFKL